MSGETRFSSGTLVSLVAAIVLVVVVLALSALSLFTYQDNLGSTLSDITSRNLERYTNQSILLFQNMISDYFSQLDTVGQFCSAGTDSPEVLELLRRNNDGNTYKRLGVAGPDGMLYIGSESPVPIVGQDYFMRAMSGERVISDVIPNNYDGKDVIVFAVPIEKNGEIVGVACAQYDVSLFTNLLGNSQFQGTGATMVMQKSGKMVSSFEGMEHFSTFYEVLEQMEFRGGDTLESFREHISQGDSGFFTYYRNGKARYLYYSPAGVSDYTMLSLVLAESMDQDAKRITSDALWLTVKNVCFYCVILVCIWVISMLVRRLVLHYQKDPLTQTFNKVSAQAAISRYLRGSGKNSVHACLFIDIDNFKTVNDRYGHSSGDRLLIDFALKLKGSFRHGDIISRFGGDEFMVFMKDVSLPEIAVKKAAALCGSITEIGEVPISISVGVSCYPIDGTSYHELIGHADEALYHAKESGKSQCRVFQTMDK